MKGIRSISFPITWISINLCTHIIATNGRDDQHHLSLIGQSLLQYHPTFFEDIERIIKDRGVKWDTSKVERMRNQQTRELKKAKNLKNNKKSKTTKLTKNCDPEDVNLLDYSQWQAERGYWIGEYTFLKGDAKPFVSSGWNYPYDSYKGFITGEVVGNAYRQRNVFLYPPQISSLCDPNNPKNVVGDGTCGVNGNTKIFEADQSVTTCPTNDQLGGDIEGQYIQGGIAFPTKTELVGKDNALLYQVFIPGAMFGQENDLLVQSQLTTITTSPTGQFYRTRSAQGFDVFGNIGKSDSVSYYRERKVDKNEFYATFNSSMALFNIREEDLCVWDNMNNLIANVTGSYATCEKHLEEAFALGGE